VFRPKLGTLFVLNRKDNQNSLIEEVSFSSRLCYFILMDFNVGSLKPHVWVILL